MRINVFNKIVSLLIVLSITLSAMLMLVGCYGGGNNGGEGELNGDDGGDSFFNGEASDGLDTDYHNKLIAPAYKEYPRDTIDFKNIPYSRPNFDDVMTAFSDAIVLIEENIVPYEQQLEAVEALEEGYGKVLTMYSLSNIYNSIDSSETFWNEEYSYITSNYPAFAGKVEDLFVAAANSPYAEQFEEYFGDDLIEEYKDGGMLTDALIQLWADEERLETEYSSLSTASIRITYKELNDTVDNILDYYIEQYGENSTEYLAAYNVCMQKYNEKTTVLSKNLLVNLVKVRRLIADELGYESYMTYAYESYDRDYSAGEISSFFNDIATYVVPVYSSLSYLVFYSYFQTNLPTDVTMDSVINDAYQAISGVDEELGDIFNYMLLYKLFDIELSEINRQSGAFTTYLNDYDAPFIFMSASGNIKDYSTLIHEFGHFADAYTNYNSSTSIDQKEVSSQALEYLMLLYMQDALHSRDIQYLTYSMLNGALETLIYQGFYGKFEELIYKIPYDDISEETLNEAIISAAQMFGLNTDYVNDISVAFIPHIFLYPFYVQSYCTSIVPALQLYFMELKNEGSGLEAYKKIIDRTECDYTFVQTLEAAGLSSPFAKGTLRKLADDIYYMVIGSHYYTEDDPESDAA